MRRGSYWEALERVSGLLPEDFFSIADIEFHWLWCGTEGDAKIIGPFYTAEDATAEAEWAKCEHDHISFASSPRRLIRSFPPEPIVLYADLCQANSLRTLVRRPSLARFAHSNPTYDLGDVVLQLMAELHRKEIPCPTPSPA